MSWSWESVHGGGALPVSGTKVLLEAHTHTAHTDSILPSASQRPGLPLCHTHMAASSSGLERTGFPGSCVASGW